MKNAVIAYFVGVLFAWGILITHHETKNDQINQGACFMSWIWVGACLADINNQVYETKVNATNTMNKVEMELK